MRERTSITFRKTSTLRKKYMNNYARTVQLIVAGLLAIALAPPNAHGEVGDYNYCTVSGPCGDGEGDCDGNSECRAGLVCVQDQGAHYSNFPPPPRIMIPPSWMCANTRTPTFVGTMGRVQPAMAIVTQASPVGRISGA